MRRGGQPQPFKERRAHTADLKRGRRKATRSVFRSRGARPLAVPIGKIGGLGRVLGVDAGVQPARWRVALATSSRRAALSDGGRYLLRTSHPLQRAASRSQSTLSALAPCRPRPAQASAWPARGCRRTCRGTAGERRKQSAARGDRKSCTALARQAAHISRPPVSPRAFLG